MNDGLRRALTLLAILVVLAGLWFLPFGQLLNSAASWSQAHTIAIHDAGTSSTTQIGNRMRYMIGLAIVCA